MDESVVGETVQVYLEALQGWFPGVIDEVHSTKGYHVQYFDGDHEWLRSLDNVQFENQMNLDDKELEHTRDFEVSDDDELIIVSNNPPPHPDMDLPEADEPEEEDESPDLYPTVHFDDYESHQDSNREAIINDLYKLSNRGVVLAGSVLSYQPFTNTSDNDSMFFKVLFVEGGNQPAIFRCKTPIYTSANASTVSANNRKTAYSVWDDEKFRFDMVMPETPDGTFKMQGDIIIGVYVSRSNGGNEVLGQTSIELSNLMRLGTMEHFRDDVDGRSITGGYPCVSRAGAEVGELHFQLNVAWLSSNITAAASAGVDAIGDDHVKKERKAKENAAASTTSGKPPTKRPGSASAVGSRGVSRTAGGGGGATVATKRPLQVGSDGVTKVVVAPQRKIVSALSRKQKEDAMRIERENKKLTARLQSHATKHSAHTEAVYVKGDTAAPTAAVTGSAKVPSEAAEAKTKYHDDRSGAGAKSSAFTAVGSGAKETYRSGAKGEYGGGGANDHAELMKIYNELKRSNSAQETENASLKANLNKINIHIKKHQLQIEKIRGRNSAENLAPSAASSFAGGGSVAGGGGGGGGASTVADSKASRPGSVGGQRESKDSEAKSSGGGSRQGSRQSSVAEFGTAVPSTATRRGPSSAIDEGVEIADDEHRAVLDEYQALTATRRALVVRIDAATGAYRSATGTSANVAARDRLLRQRIGYYSAAHMINKIPSSGVVAADEKGHGSSSNVRGVDRNALSIPPADTNSDDYILFERLRTATEELQRLEAMVAHNMHTAAAESQVAELRSVERVLREQMETVQSEIDRMRQDKAKKQELLQTLISRDSVMNIRQFISQMHARLCSLQRDERLDTLSDSYKTIELELLRLKLRQKERKDSIVGVKART